MVTWSSILIEIKYTTILNDESELISVNLNQLIPTNITNPITPKLHPNKIQCTDLTIT